MTSVSAGTSGGHLRHEVAQLLEDVAGRVELLRQRPGPLGHLPLQRRRLPHRPQPPVGHPDAVLPVGQAVHGMGPQGAPQVVEHRVVRGRGAVLDPPGAQVVLDAGIAQRGGEIAPGVRAAVVEVLGHPHPGERGLTGLGKSTEPSRPAHLSSVSTSGRGSARSVMPGSRTTARPCRRPDGTRITSPGRSAPRASAASIRRLACESRESSFSRSAICCRSCAYSPTSPRSECISAAARSASCSCFAAARARPDDGPVGLELRERGREQLPRPRAAERADQVDRHVVARPERRPQRERAGAGQARDGGGVDAGRPDDDGVALHVDPAAAGAPGELGVLPRRHVDVRLAVPLHQPLEDDAARRHVDAQREGLGGEHGLHQAADEALLDGLLERRHQPRVVRGEAGEQPLPPLPEAEDVQVLLGQRAGAPVDDLGDLRALGLGR